MSVSYQSRFSRDWLTLRHCLLLRSGFHRSQMHSFLAQTYTVVCLPKVEIRKPYPFLPSDCGISSVWAVFLNLERKIGHDHDCQIYYCVVLCFFTDLRHTARFQICIRKDNALNGTKIVFKYYEISN